ncbi:P-loop containing nucleoside triphosphate hydrolase protein [Mycena sanguinolenta]|nr:P-loop containing nucleoside triphosphate hydrolase protein [Mycena sanguinolenta]
MASPWTLDNYLSYGFLAIVLLDADEIRPQMQNQNLAEDGWYTFAAPEYKSNEYDHDLLKNLEFLVLNKFVFASFLLAENWLFIRIYLIPYDLPGVKGELRNRPDTIVSRARNYLAGILPKISRDPECWAGYNVPDTPLIVPGTTLSGIYEDLPSPDGLVTAASTPTTRRLLNFSDTLDNFGIKTKPYRYQRRTVAAMIQKEMDLKDDPDPLFLPVTGMNNKQFFFQPGTMEVLSERPLVAPCRGGILCEELGTGKTLMILTLIVSTRRQLSEPEPSILDSRPVLTPLAFRHFPSGEFADARERFLRNTNSRPNLNLTPLRVPTLVELLLHQMATRPLTFISESQTHRHRQLRKDVKKLKQYKAPLKDNIPFYLDYPEQIDDERAYKRRAPVQSGPRLLYLTSATLVVVPSNLLLQWENECSLHCKNLDMCVIRNEPLPSARVLAKYDLVLMTYDRFRAEDRSKDKDSKDSTWRGCTCAEHPNVRVPKCQCKPLPGSPLLHVRWKRLVIDEGHVSASLSTVLTHFTKTLSVERRWIVTGTPTTNLLGLNLGKTINEDVAATPAEASEVLPSRTPSEIQGPETVDVDDDDDPFTAPRVWTSNDGEDLTKFGNMIAHFVGVPQLLANSKIFGTHVSKPLLDSRGPLPGAVEVLMQLMSSVMFRHRVADVELEVKLPPVTQELVLLDLDPLVVKSYNALQAIIAVNAVTSERKDLDYMFHSKNGEWLQEAVENMSQLMFWRVDDNLYNSGELLRTADEKMKKLSPATSPEDIQLMNDAFHHLKIAADDPLWCALQNHEDVPFRVYDLKQPVFEAWTRTTHSPDPDHTLYSQCCGYIHPDRLRELKNHVLKQPLISQDALITKGINVAEEDAKMKAFYLESLKRKRTSKSSHSQEDSGSRKATQAAKNAADTETMKKVEKELAALSSDSSPPARNDVHRPSALVAKSHIANTRLGCSASSKLNFIINEVLKYSATEKFLIFSDSPLSLAHISEALELLGVDYLRFTTQIPAEKRKQFVLTFETSDTYRVFLMELKHGARGLNLISASRVIFCEPVWRADVESQAIKRAHRMGQTRPITVKTLAIRGTAEENMAARRLALKDSTEKIPKLIYESGMRSFIANPKFLTHTPTVLPVVEFPLVKLAPTEDDEDVAMTEVEIEPRQVRFALDKSPSSPVKRRLDGGMEDRPTRKIRLLPPGSEPRPRPTVRFA